MVFNPATPARGHLFMNFVISYAYDAAYVNNYATVLDSYVKTSSLGVAKVSSKEVTGLDGTEGNHIISMVIH